MHSRLSLIRHIIISLGVFGVLLTIFALSPVKTPYDSRWSIHTAMSLARGHDGALTEYLPALAQSGFYAIEYPDGKPRTLFPIGVSILAIPFVVVASWFDPSFEKKLQTTVLDGPEKIIASIFGAIAGCVFLWLILGQFESLPIALTATAIFCFGTSMWSTATRALWQHGPLVLMLVIAMLLLLRARTRPQFIQFVSLPLAIAYVIRPTAIVPILVLSIYVLLYYRKWLVRYIAWAMPIALPWTVFNWTVYHALVSPYYYHNAFYADSNVSESLLVNLFSPSRGLFVYSPVLLFAISGFVIALRDREQRPLNIAYGAIIIGHTFIIANARVWWAGHSFGPRFMTDIIPFLAYFTAFNLQRAMTTLLPRRVALLGGIGALALISIVINAQGALRRPPMGWNVLPDNIDRHPSRVWDWSDPQFARTKWANIRMQEH